MAITPETFAAAKKLSTPAVADLLADRYPVVHRLAYGLSGREDVGRGIERFVLGRAVRMLPEWKDEEVAEHWFYHYTIITARRAIKHRPDPREDVLLAERGAEDPAYVAFVTALRNLPRQQQEAFILQHGEHVGGRTTALAMDCSLEAAGNHLRAATEDLRRVAGEQFDMFVLRLSNAYRRLAPSAELVLPSMKSLARRRVWPRRLLRWTARAAMLALLVGLAWISWRAYHEVEI
jgi:DNA-directed RNA polymerase specialized sigma24 family protein